MTRNAVTKNYSATRLDNGAPNYRVVQTNQNSTFFACCTQQYASSSLPSGQNIYLHDRSKDMEHSANGFFHVSFPKQ